MSMKAIIDCNSFYCSCERLFRPDLWDRPVVVLSNNDGCIVSRTDEAKKLGVGMAAEAEKTGRMTVDIWINSLFWSAMAFSRSSGVTRS